MKRGLCIALIGAWPLGAIAQSADVQAQAESALRNGIPQSAIAPVKEALRKGQGEGAALTRMLARLQLAAGAPDEALATLDASGPSDSDEWKVLRAASLAAQGDGTAASALLTPLAPANPEATLLLARIRAEQGDQKGAADLLSALPQDQTTGPQQLRLLLDLRLAEGNETATSQLLERIEAGKLLPEPEVATARGRFLLARNRPKEASAAFQSALSHAEIAPQVRDHARLGLARAALAADDTTKARAVLREALVSGPTPAALRQTMEEWIALEKAAGADPSGELRSWSAEQKSARGIEAALQLAQLDLEAEGTEAAAKSLREMLARPDLQPTQRKRAELLSVEASIASGQSAEALAVLDRMDAQEDYRVAMLRGRALAASGAYRQAQACFAAGEKSGSTAEEKSAAAANRFITALAGDDTASARAALESLRATTPQNPRLPEWSFLLAAAEAREGSNEALSVLARRNPSAGYAFQAKLALAEWRLTRNEPEAAGRVLKTATDEADTPGRAAALAAAEIFAADLAGAKTRGELAAECESFLAEHGSSPEAEDVSFKLAEILSRGGDHAAAETVLAGLAEKISDGESAALAKFLAAQAAARSMSAAAADRALVWLNELAQGQSSLKHRARFEQASLLLRQKKFADALALHESTLAADPPDDVRHAAQMERADILFAMGTEHPEKLDEAEAAYGSVASDQTAPPDWRDQAACKRAAALAKRGQTEKALALYREILDRSPAEGADQFWFLKAGTDAARLLEEQQDWAAAVAVYDRLASASGAQREELEQRARRLKLEHFIWDN